MAEIYRDQGYKISPRNEIKKKIMDATGLAENTILHYLQAIYKQSENVPPPSQTKVTATHRVEARLGSEVAERFREEVLAEEKLSPEEKLKWQIETDLFYLCTCSHCEIVFLVEEAANHFQKLDPDRIALRCPVCHTENLIPKAENRLKLKLEKIMQPDEINPYYSGIIERSKKGGDKKQ